MPLVKIQTNSDLNADDQERLVRKMSAITARELGKPERYVMVLLESGTRMLFAGEDSPAMYLELKSIGLPEDLTAGLSRSLSQVILDETGIPAERVYIEFSNAPRHLWGWDGGTF